MLEVVAMPKCIPHNYALWVELDGDDVWVGTSKGLGRARGAGYYPGLRAGSPRRSPVDVKTVTDVVDAAARE